MGFELGPNRYGKAGIHLATVVRGEERHEFSEREVEVRLEGDFDGGPHARRQRARSCPPTRCGARPTRSRSSIPGEPLEAFALRYTRYLLDASPAASRAEAWMTERPWERVVIDGEPHPHAFTRGAFRWTTHVVRDRDEVRLSGGLDELYLLKTTGSAFSGFLKDRFTILPETDDRILATQLDAQWRYGRTDLEFAKQREACREALVRAFAHHDDSRSVQHTLWHMGTAVLEAARDVEEVTFSLPNLHHVAVDLSYCGIRNDGRVFVVTDKPSGRIEGTVRRTEDVASG